MERYADLGRDSGVLGYEIEPDRITVIFKGGKRTYTYSYGRAGQHHIENMKGLAIRGQGLNAYINMNVKNLYD